VFYCICFGLTGHIQVYKLFCSRGLHKATATATADGSSSLYCAAMTSLLSFRCEAVMDVFILPDWMHYPWRSATVNGTDLKNPL
jgi:hypothetical protein